MPIDRLAFSKGLLRLATAARKALDDATLEFYHEALAEEADPETWEAFTRRVAKDGDFRWSDGTVCIPDLPTLMESYRHERSVIAGRLLPAGETWRPPTVEELEATEADRERAHAEMVKRWRDGLPSMKARLKEHGIDVEKIGGTA